jgi:hypothetical protein
MIDWTPVTDSTRVIAVAYDEEAEVVYVRFRNGTEWQYEGCPPLIWEEFVRPGISKGSYIRNVLDHRPNRRTT